MVNGKLFRQYYSEIKTLSDIHVYLINADEATYKYMVSSSLQRMTGFIPFAEPVMVYSNVPNGYGIIGSYSVVVKSISYK